MGQSLDSRPRLTHDVKWVGGMGLIGLAAVILAGPFPAGAGLAVAGDGVSRPYATMLACAADITSAGSTIDYWTSALKDKDPHIRSLAATALGETRNAAAVPALIEALKDEDEKVRLLAIQALGRIGREARTAAPALMKTLKDTRPNISAEAARTLEKIRQPQ